MPNIVPGEKQPLLEIRQVTKTFPGVTALRGVDFTIFPGEIHVLVGENGAGKSTLMKIISGVYPPDSGSVVVKGTPVSEFTPHAARQRGIATVFQELSLVLDLTVAENIVLAREPVKLGVWLDGKRRLELSLKYLALLDSHLDPGVRVRSLGVAQQQMVEIAKALSLDPQVLIMDEPTSKLFGQETETLFRLVKRLRDEGKGIIWITHRLEEVQSVANRVTVFRDGALIGTMDSSSAQTDTLIKMMVGRELGQMYHRTKHQLGEELIRTEGLGVGSRLRSVNLTLRRGEIVGLIGLVGAGRSLLAKTLAGVVRPTAGSIFFKSKPVHIKNPQQANRLGIAFIPEDRRAHSLIMNMSVRDNIVLPSLNQPFLPFGTLDTMANGYVEQLKIRTPSISSWVNRLSGGNQQKVVIAKWLNFGAQLFIFDEPTQGIDVGTKAQIYALLDELAHQGSAVLLISSDMNEVMGVSDRILVMCNGELSGEFTRGQALQEEILRRAILGNITSGGIPA